MGDVGHRWGNRIDRQCVIVEDWNNQVVAGDIFDRPVDLQFNVTATGRGDLDAENSRGCFGDRSDRDRSAACVIKITCGDACSIDVFAERDGVGDQLVQCDEVVCIVIDDRDNTRWGGISAGDDVDGGVVKHGNR